MILSFLETSKNLLPPIFILVEPLKNSLPTAVEVCHTSIIVSFLLATQKACCIKSPESQYSCPTY
jgi:hypothetical protein